MPLGMGGTVTVKHETGPDGPYWEVGRGGNYISAHENKSPAVEKARKLAMDGGGTLKIYTQNGSLQETREYDDGEYKSHSLF